MDLIVGNVGNELKIIDYHLSPLSNSIPFVYKSDETLLNNTHQDNIKKYYHLIKGNFYNKGLSSEFYHNWPILINDDLHFDNYSNVYDMGCKRTKHYNIYKKQFEFLCPLWIEHIDNNDNCKLSFTISVKTVNNNKTICSKKLIFDFKNTNNVSTHDKFVKYLYKYCDDAGLFDGNDELLNIKFKTGNASVTGLDVSNGLFITKKIDSLITNITTRERPLMEVDNLLVDAFKNNTIIAKQLFNFNICFNLEDLFSKTLLNMIYGNKIIVSVIASINDVELENKDFYSNYEYIERISNDTNIIDKSLSNVFSYLQDNKYIEFINKNKFAQNIIHWSLCDNNDYIFNVYNGFSGLLVNTNDKNEKIYVENEHQYGNAPNTFISQFSNFKNTAGWINIKNINSFGEFYKYLTQTNTLKYDGVNINNDISYINNIKYKKLEIDAFEDFFVLGLYTDTKTYSIISDSYDFKYLNKEASNLCYIKISDLLILLTDDINDLTFKRMYNILHNNYTNLDTEISILYSIMKCKIDPELIVFNNSLLWTITDGPSKNIEEITYLKDNDTTEYVFRYDGKIKPTFVNDNNILYYKDSISNDNNNYKKYNNSGYEPLYPSINYCSIKSIKDWNYKQIPTEITNNIEYSWFNNGLHLILSPKITFKCVVHKDNIDTLNELINNHMCNFYKIDNMNVVKYILSKYDITYDWNYVKNDVTNYEYNIILTLK